MLMMVKGKPDACLGAFIEALALEARRATQVL